MAGFIFQILGGLLFLLEIAIIASAVMSWLVYFNVINGRHPFVRQMDHVLWSVTRPVLWPIRKVIPSLGTVDISPVIAILIIEAARSSLLPWLFRLVPYAWR